MIMKLFSLVGLVAIVILILQACASETDMHFRTTVFQHDDRPRYQPPRQVRVVNSAPVVEMQVSDVPLSPPPTEPVIVNQPPVHRIVGPNPEDQPKTYAGGGSLTVGAFHTESLLVITQYGSQRVQAIVDEKGLPIVVKDQQGPPPVVVGLVSQETLVPLAISTNPPGHSPIWTRVWVVSGR